MIIINFFFFFVRFNEITQIEHPQDIEEDFKILKITAYEEINIFLFIFLCIISFGTIFLLCKWSLKIKMIITLKKSLGKKSNAFLIYSKSIKKFFNIFNIKLQCN